MNSDVVVVGGGFAGLSAAVRLATAGAAVTVVEGAPRLGGRASTFTDRESAQRVDNGQHVLFGCYRETYGFLRSIGTDGLAPLQSGLRVSMADERGQTFPLACPSMPPPWHLLAGVLRWPAIPLRDRLGVIALRGVLKGARRKGSEAVAAEVLPDQTVSDWLRSHGQSPAICRWLWHPLAIAALNQSPDLAAARPFVRVLAELFGPKVEDSSIGLPRVPLDELYAEPARRFIERHGGRVLTNTLGRVVVAQSGSLVGVRAGDELIAATAVISAVPWYAFEKLWEAEIPAVMKDTASRAMALPCSPIVTVNIWFDGPVSEERFVGLVGGSMHWVFDKAAIVGDRSGHLSVVASGADEIARMTNAELEALALTELRRALPLSRDRRFLRSVVVREHRATFSLQPGLPERPPNDTPLAGFYLAGDWTDTGLPGTIESAVQSGHTAARLASQRLQAG
jgi:squalene-associated FAD-dependent desaturase